jgi:hypothetical protein
MTGHRRPSIIGDESEVGPGNTFPNKVHVHDNILGVTRVSALACRQPYLTT